MPIRLRSFNLPDETISRLEEIARMALDACEREKYARSFAEIRAAERDKLIARDLFIAAVSDTVAVNLRARAEA